MTGFVFYIWLAFLILYILSPIDAHPLFLDDIIVSVILFYLLYKNARRRGMSGYSNARNHTRENRKSSSGPGMTIDSAYKTLEISPDASFDEVKKAYKEKIATSHPDKVSHLSLELQEKAKELTLKLNSAFDTIKKQRGI
jgi:uncharacterized membrane protein YkvA (DUF1232 family)